MTTKYLRSAVYDCQLFSVCSLKKWSHRLCNEVTDLIRLTFDIPVVCRLSRRISKFYLWFSVIHLAWRSFCYTFPHDLRALRDFYVSSQNVRIFSYVFAFRVNILCVLDLAEVSFLSDNMDRQYFDTDTSSENPIAFMKNSMSTTFRHFHVRFSSCYIETCGKSCASLLWCIVSCQATCLVRTRSKLSSRSSLHMSCTPTRSWLTFWCSSRWVNIIWLVNTISITRRILTSCRVQNKRCSNRTYCGKFWSYFSLRTSIFLCFPDEINPYFWRLTHSLSSMRSSKKYDVENHSDLDLVSNSFQNTMDYFFSIIKYVNHSFQSRFVTKHIMCRRYGLGKCQAVMFNRMSIIERFNLRPRNVRYCD